jgi:hypothetical protein
MVIFAGPRYRSLLMRQLLWHHCFGRQRLAPRSCAPIPAQKASEILAMRQEQAGNWLI